MFKHGFSRRTNSHPLFKRWCSMKDRVRYHKEYIKKGIVVCQEWLDNFINFYNWAIENGFNESLQLDRINNDGNYEPSNCRWVDRIQQARNQRYVKNSKTKIRGVTVGTDGRYYARIFFKGERISLGYFDNIEDAIKARKDAEKKYWNREV